MVSSNKSVDTNPFIKLSYVAIDLMDKVLLTSAYPHEILAISTVPISNWLTHDYYVYSCLFANRCHKLDRIILSDKNQQQIMANNDERISMKTIIQAHEVCLFDCRLIVYDKLYEALEHNASGFFREEDGDREYFLNLKNSPNGKYKFDFLYVPLMKGIAGAIIKPVFPDDDGNSVGIEVLVASEELGERLKKDSTKLSVTLNNNTIRVNKSRYLRYYNLYRLLNACRMDKDIQPLQSKLFLA